MQKIAHHNPVIILMEPQGALNIGSTCRTMLNFGCEELRLVKPQTDHLGEAARLMAVRADNILAEAKIFPDLDSAVADINLLFGTSRRFGKRYREDFLSPAAAASRISGAAPDCRTALLFGREDKGLTNDELDRCHHFIAIPTSSELASLNLAQAVNICLYEIHCHAPAPANALPPSRVPAAAAELESMLLHMRGSLLRLGFLTESNPDHILHTFRRIFGRTELDSREVKILQGLWSCLDDLRPSHDPDQ